MSFDLSAEELFVACWVSSLYFLVCYPLVNYPPLSQFWVSFQFAWCCGGSSCYRLVKLHSETCQLERQLSNTQLYQPSRHKRRWNGRVRGNCRMSHTRTIDFSFDAVKVSRLKIQYKERNLFLRTNYICCQKISSVCVAHKHTQPTVPTDNSQCFMFRISVLCSECMSLLFLKLQYKHNLLTNWMEIHISVKVLHISKDGWYRLMHMSTWRCWTDILSGCNMAHRGCSFPSFFSFQKIFVYLLFVCAYMLQIVHLFFQAIFFHTIQGPHKYKKIQMTLIVVLKSICNIFS